MIDRIEELCDRIPDQELFLRRIQKGPTWWEFKLQCEGLGQLRIKAIESADTEAVQVRTQSSELVAGMLVPYLHWSNDTLKAMEALGAAAGFGEPLENTVKNLSCGFPSEGGR